MQIPSKARAVIIGGGVIGCSIAYHLGKLGWKDVVLLERKQLTCGTTWHAAGLIAQLRATQNMTRLAKYSQELYFGLEAETGVATGFKRNGSITVALTDERMEELRRSAAMARAFGVEIDEITPVILPAAIRGWQQAMLLAACGCQRTGRQIRSISPKHWRRGRAILARQFCKGSRLRQSSRPMAASRVLKLIMGRLRLTMW